HDLPVRVRLRDLHSVQWRVDDAHLRALGPEAEEIGVRAGHAEHVAEGREDDAGLPRDRVGLVDLLQGGDTDGTAGAVNQLDPRGEEAVDAVLDDRMRLAAADLHERPRARRDALDLSEHLRGELPVAVFVEVLHGPASGTSSSPS